MEDVNKSLVDKLEQQHFLLRNVSVFYNYSKYLTVPPTESEAFTANYNLFLRHSRIAYWKLTVIEICKLLDRKGNYSFLKVINILETHYKKIKWCKPVTPQTIKDIKDIYIKLEEDVCTNNLKTLRNEFYAHLDSSRKDINDYMKGMNHDDFENYLRRLKSQHISFMYFLKGDESIVYEQPNEHPAEKEHLIKLMQIYSKYRLEL